MGRRPATAIRPAEPRVKEAGTGGQARAVQGMEGQLDRGAGDLGTSPAGAKPTLEGGVDRWGAMAYIPPPFEGTRFAGWSSPVARQAHNLKVTGSNPVPATSLP